MVKIKTIHPGRNDQVAYDAPDEVFVSNMVTGNETVSKYIGKIMNDIECGDIESARKETRKAIYSCQKLEQYLRSFPKVFGLPGAVMDIKKELAEDGNIAFEILEGNVLHIKLPELFPQRFRGGVMMEQYDNMRSRYVSSFDLHFKNNPFQRYKERVVVLYKSNYKMPSDIIDYDNFDLKQITDCISTYCLIDDNPSRMMALSDYGIGEEEYSEVYVIPMSQFESYSKDLFK